MSLSIFIEKRHELRNKSAFVHPLFIGMETRFLSEKSLVKEVVDNGAPLCVGKVFELTKHEPLKEAKKFEFLRPLHSPSLLL